MPVIAPRTPMLEPTRLMLVALPVGDARFWMLSMLNASKRSCKVLPSATKTLLVRDKSRLVTGELCKLLRPSFPKVPTGEVKAQGLNQLCEIRVRSAARPPWDMVFWQSGFGFAATGPRTNGSAIWFGRE